MTAAVVGRDALGRLEPLAAGGTARIYRLPAFALPGAPRLVYKEYRPKVRAMAGPGLRPGLLALAEFPERLDATPRSQWKQRVIWPLRVVVDGGGAALGVVMALIPDRFFQAMTAPSGAVSSRPRELDQLFGATSDARRRGLDAVPIRTRLGICAQIARTYGLMHRAGVVIGDVSGRNILYAVGGPVPEVLVVDTDSVRVRGTRSPFGAQPHTPRWEPPEALDALARLRSARRSAAEPSVIQRLAHASMIQSKETDVYKYGLLVVRMLDPGRNRTGNRDPAVAARELRHHVGRAAADLLVRSLGADPGERPAMRDWYEALTGRRRVVTPPPEPKPAPEPRPASVPERRSGDWLWVEGTGWMRQVPRREGGGRG